MQRKPWLLLKGLFLVCTVATSMVLLMVCASLSAERDTFAKGLTAYMKRDYRTAVVHLKEYVAHQPDANAYYFLGYASYEMNQMKEAAEYFREAYLIDPNFTPKITGHGKTKQRRTRK